MSEKKFILIEGCTCEEEHYPCAYCQKLAMKEIREIDKNDKEIRDRIKGSNGLKLNKI